MSLTTRVAIPDDINKGVTNAKQATMMTLLGAPRADFTAKDQPITNPKIKKLMVTDTIGLFRATGLNLAVKSLKDIFSEIKTTMPEIYESLRTDGMLCVRLVRESSDSISIHSWGAAIDLKFTTGEDVRGDGMVLSGLAAIAPIFNKHKWYWGAEFPTEDGMHFECSDELIREWANNGAFSEISAALRPSTPELSYGDRGPQVKDLQEKLNKFGAGLLVDQIFGRDTLAALMQFQARNGIAANGVVDDITRLRLNA